MKHVINIINIFQCVDECLMKEASGKIKCRGPFTPTTALPECSNFTSFQSLIILEKQISQEGLQDCDCPRSCNINYYSGFVISRTTIEQYNETGWGELHLYFPSPAVTRIREFWAYDLSQFVGETGGSMGLLLGISVISILDLLSDFYKFLRTYFENHKV